MSPAAEQPLKICIRGLPSDSDLRAIQKDLRERGFDPIFMRHVKARDKGSGVFCVKLQITPNISTVYDIKKLLGVYVRVEAWRGRQGPPQCQRCQGFRHSAAECVQEYRCVHCARPHPSKNCNRPYDIPTCANCNGPHAADDFSCPAMRREEIAKAGKVLRVSGYTLTSANPVAEKSAPTSLMAVANTNWQSSQRKRRKRNKQAKMASLLPERPESQLKEPETQAFANPTVNKPEPKLQEAQKLAAPVITNTKPQPVFQAVQEALTKSFTKKEYPPLLKESEQLLSKLNVEEKSNFPVENIQQEVVLEIETQSTAQNTQKVSAKLVNVEQPKLTKTADVLLAGPMIKEKCHIPDQAAKKVLDPIKKKSQSTAHEIQQVFAKPMSIEKGEHSKFAHQDPVRAEVVSECVLVLQSVLSALQEGHNPVPIILGGLADLCHNI